MAEICRTFKWEVLEMLKLTVHTKGLEEIKDKLMQASSKAEHTLAIQIRKDTSPKAY